MQLFSVCCQERQFLCILAEQLPSERESYFGNVYILMSLVTFYTSNAKSLNFQGYKAPTAKERVYKVGGKTPARTEQKAVDLDAELIYRFTPPHSDSETTLVMDFTCGTGKTKRLLLR